MENLRKLVFRHIKLKLLTKASISCLSHPSVSYNLIYECFHNCMFAKNYAFLHVSQGYKWKLQHIKLWKFAVVLQVYQVWITSEMVGFLHWFTWHGMTHRSNLGVWIHVFTVLLCRHVLISNACRLVITRARIFMTSYFLFDQFFHA
jgi:hypothetical protein